MQASQGVSHHKWTPLQDTKSMGNIEMFNNDDKVQFRKFASQIRGIGRKFPLGKEMMVWAQNQAQKTIKIKHSI